MILVKYPPGGSTVEWVFLGLIANGPPPPEEEDFVFVRGTVEDKERRHCTIISIFMYIMLSNNRKAFRELSAVFRPESEQPHLSGFAAGTVPVSTAAKERRRKLNFYFDVNRCSFPAKYDACKQKSLSI